MQYTRLNDREYRNDRNLGRKRVFLACEGEEKFVEIRFGANYRPLYDKTLTAFRQVPAEFIGKLLESDNETTTLKIEYLGAALEPTPGNLPKVIRFLEQLQEVAGRRAVFTKWRYLTTLAEATSDKTIAAFVERIVQSSYECRAGYGIDDPVMSNFTEDAAGVHLVDLDHFSADQSGSYQAGFVMADVDLLSNSSLASTSEILVKRYEEYSNHSAFPDDEQLPLLIGYISRLGVDVINSTKELNSFHSEASLRTIRKLIAAIS